MKRSEINTVIGQAAAFFKTNGWTLPPEARWDVTDFGLQDLNRYGLVLINLAEEIEYCEKLMYARKNMTTPAHCHAKKKEDIIARAGTLIVQLWKGKPSNDNTQSFTVNICGKPTQVVSGEKVTLNAGERVTLVPGIYHEFWPETDECIIGEVSTANDDLNDNFFINPDVGRFPGIEEDEPALIKLLSDK
ncbi:MAG: D-lyxose/D-mannose family sugar isomerase [Verrucomicrobiota bacterium]|nr:D-lyxose/D-mannose family sugar isomerase [Verrucomicrobiota bacterium]